MDEDKKALAAITKFPSPVVESKNPITDKEKISLIEENFKNIMQVLGLDLQDPSLANTPHRVAKMYVNEIFSGLESKNFPRVSFIEDLYHNNGKSSIVFIKVRFTSFCEHHFVPFQGTAYVAYYPNGKLIGLSKISRIVKFFSKRPQVQERLTAQIADSIALLLNTEDVAVSLTAQHFCVAARGIEDQDSFATTQVLRGTFDLNNQPRQEFFDAIKRDSARG